MVETCFTSVSLDEQNHNLLAGQSSTKGFKGFCKAGFWQRGSGLLSKTPFKEAQHGPLLQVPHPWDGAAGRDKKDKGAPCAGDRDQ